MSSPCQIKYVSRRFLFQLLSEMQVKQNLLTHEEVFDKHYTCNLLFLHTQVTYEDGVHFFDFQVICHNDILQYGFLKKCNVSMIQYLT